MLLDTYQADDRFWITTFFGRTSEGLQAFRGDFVVKHGELNVAAGKRNPPEALLRQAVILADAGALKLIAGNFASVEELPELIARFGADMEPDCVIVLFIDNLASDAVVSQDGRRYCSSSTRGDRLERADGAAICREIRSEGPER
jgi:hypothetical protein